MYGNVGGDKDLFIVCAFLVAAKLVLPCEINKIQIILIINLFLGKKKKNYSSDKNNYCTLFKLGVSELQSLFELTELKL